MYVCIYVYVCMHIYIYIIYIYIYIYIYQCAFELSHFNPDLHSALSKRARASAHLRDKQHRAKQI